MVSFSVMQVAYRNFKMLSLFGRTMTHCSSSLVSLTTSSRLDEKTARLTHLTVVCALALDVRASWTALGEVATQVQQVQVQADRDDHCLPKRDQNSSGSMRL